VMLIFARQLWVGKRIDEDMRRRLAQHVHHENADLIFDFNFPS
jgi:hypothetical protein